MKKGHFTEILLFALVAALSVLLIVLTVLTIGAVRNSGSTSESFDLDRLTAEKTESSSDLISALLPEFIGITDDGERLGLSGSENIMSVLYGDVSPALSSLLVPSNAEDAEDGDALWRSLVEEESSVYIRYHSALPDSAIGIFADWSSGERQERGPSERLVYELFLLPANDRDRPATIIARDPDGAVSLYRSGNSSSVLTTENLARLIRSYRTFMQTYVFAEERYPGLSVTEPVLIDVPVCRSMMIADGTSFMARNDPTEQEKILRLFGLNTDKLLSTHVDENGDVSFTDARGAFYIRSSSLEYTAAIGGGLETDTILNYSESTGLERLIETAVTILSRLRAIGSYYVGGDAGVYLDRVVSKGGVTELSFSYSLDCIRIAGLEPAFTATFRDGVLTQAKVYTLSAQKFGARTALYHEWWFADAVSRQGLQPYNIGMVYRSDFLAESVFAEWSAETRY